MENIKSVTIYYSCGYNCTTPLDINYFEIVLRMLQNVIKNNMVVGYTLNE